MLTITSMYGLCSEEEKVLPIWNYLKGLNLGANFKVLNSWLQHWRQIESISKISISGEEISNESEGAAEFP